VNLKLAILVETLKNPVQINKLSKNNYNAENPLMLYQNNKNDRLKSLMLFYNYYIVKSIPKGIDFALFSAKISVNLQLFTAI
jgi:hypothetical protein